MKFLHPDAVKVLEEHGIRMEGNIAHFTEDQIMEWVGKAPATAELHAADPQYDVSIGEDRSYNAPACTTVTLLDHDGNRRNASLDDFTKIIKLYEANPAYKINGGVPIHPPRGSRRMVAADSALPMPALPTSRCGRSPATTSRWKPSSR